MFYAQSTNTVISGRIGAQRPLQENREQGIKRNPNKLTRSPRNKPITKSTRKKKKRKKGSNKNWADHDPDSYSYQT